jgi:hypothetical protein
MREVTEIDKMKVVELFRKLYVIKSRSSGNVDKVLLGQEMYGIYTDSRKE